jgi:F0F1-type ATP synthase delta subunit
VLREAIATALVHLFEKSNDQFSAHIDIHATLDPKESDAFAQMLQALCEAAVGAFRPQLTDIHRTAE